ncbi:MAG TPA: hypothetical protein VE262_11800 [Blastocatellia bacterium]|nr:hypothetical protein [Blastocatellia bacterium]
MPETKIDDPQACACGALLPSNSSQHFYKCPCGRVWLKPDCSESCGSWSEY